VQGMKYLGSGMTSLKASRIDGFRSGRLPLADSGIVPRGSVPPLARGTLPRRFRRLLADFAIAHGLTDD
jgi:hypothetical protein